MLSSNHYSGRVFQRVLLSFTISSLFLQAGCIQMAANLMHVMSGPQVPAEFKGLENKRVAIVANNENGICTDESTIRLSGNVKGILIGKLPKTTFVSQEEVDRWLAGKTSEERDLVALGKGVSADYVIAVEMLALKLKDGPTLYRGRSNLSVTVWDTKANRVAFRKMLPEYTYPLMAGQTTTETDEDKFRRVYLMNVADKIGRYFYPHDFGEDVAIDATILNY